jgi:hypothetical protein
MLNKIRSRGVIIFALFAVFGCAEKKPLPAIGEGCDSSAITIIQEILSDDSLKKYAGNYLRKNERMLILWDGAPSSSKLCATEKINFELVDSSGFSAEKSSEYVIITKFYYDEDAAFVELLLHPTGKNGDFFLRKNNGWKITKKDFWESSY